MFSQIADKIRWFVHPVALSERARALHPDPEGHDRNKALPVFELVMLTSTGMCL